MEKIILKNYEIDNLVSRLFVFSLLVILLFFVILKMYNLQLAIVLSAFFTCFSFFYSLLNLKKVVIGNKNIEVIYVIRTRKMEISIEDVYLNSHYPPAATWSGEKAQIRLVKNNKLLIAFDKQDNLFVFNYLINVLKIKERNWN